MNLSNDNEDQMMINQDVIRKDQDLAENQIMKDIDFETDA